MAVSSVNYQCPACGGPLTFNAAEGTMKCDFCESTFTPEEIEASLANKTQAQEQKAEKQQPDMVEEAKQEHDWVEEANESSSTTATKSADPIADYLASKKELSEGDSGTTCVQCSSCGAQLIVDSISAVSTCPYCGNNSINPGKLSGALEPDYVIPFATTKEQAIEALKEHYKGKILLPKPFSSANHIEEIQGVYVPFWLYDGESSGHGEYTCENIRTWSDSDYDYTETTTYHASRSGYADFKLVPVDGSARMPDDHMDSIEPYDYSQLKPFSAGYLPGFMAERYDESVADCAPRARKRMESSVESGLHSTVTGYMNVNQTSFSGDTDVSKVSYALMPVWMLHTRWNDQDFLFAMNGQTGKLVGDLPCDKKKLVMYAAGSFVAAFIVGFAALMALL